MKKTIISIFILATLGLTFFLYNVNASKPKAPKNVSYEIDKTTINPGQQLDNSKDWYKDAIFYHLWVKAFNDGKYEDGIGDIPGIIKKLDYLNDGNPNTNTDLGITAIWLSPIFECGYKGENMHGYDTTDYFNINDRFGKKKDLEKLLIEAHKRGIRLVFDFIPNHTSVNNKWFKEHPEWFVWSKNPSKKWGYAWGGGRWTNVWARQDDKYYYGVFGGLMPDLNYKRKEVKTAVKNVLKYWLDRGFDGARLDAVRFLWENGPGKQGDQPQTHKIIQDFRKFVDKYPGNKMIVAEAWNDEEPKTIKDYYGNGKNEVNMSFDFEYAYAVSRVVNFDKTVAKKKDPYYIIDLMKWEKEAFPVGARSATFITNHDKVESRPFTAYDENKAKCIQAAALNILSHGTPFVYYGNEIGMQGDMKHDINLRQNFDWEEQEDQADESDSIFTWYKSLIKARHTYSSLRRDFIIKNEGREDRVIVILRHDKKTSEYTAIAYNVSDETKSSTVDLGIGNNQPVSAIIGETKGVNSMSGTKYTFKDIPAHGVRVLYIGDNTKSNIISDFD